MTDAARFEALVREYQDMVFAVAVRLLANPTEAEDVAQTVFLRAFERFDEIGTSPTVAGWLKTVTTNVCLNHLSRYRSRWRLFSEMTSGSPGSPGGAGKLDSASEGAGYEATLVAPAAERPAFEQAEEHERLETA